MSVLNKVNVISSIGYDSKICQKLSQERQESIAGVFSTYTHSWLTCGPDLFVVNNRDGVLQSYWTFGENLQDDLEITCVAELPLEGCAIPLLILGISSENVNLISFFNPNTRKILRTIDIIYPVRTLCVIEDGTNEVYPLNDALTPTEGLIAIGCAEGTVLLIDLCRSILCKAVNGDFRFYSSEENPSEVVYVGANAVTSGGLSQKIVENRKKKNCLSVILTDPSEEGITALLYSIESAVLFVGTSSGSFHMWNMSSLSCLFRSPGTNRAVISMSLLEPCDDPRHNLYLWICFEEFAQVAMYCISFSSKFFVQGYGVYYQNFESTGLVYRFTLGMEVDVLAKRPICSQAVAKLVPKNLVRCISLPEAEGTHLRLFVTAYEIVDKGQVSIRALIFDLNQWYRDQMPEEGISTCLDSIDLDCKSLWHLQIDPNSLTLYQCVRPQEQHFHPTSFDFQVWCIEEEGVRCLEKLGLQAQWLRNIGRIGPDILVDPTQVFLGALAAGLLPSFIDPPDLEANDQMEERGYVMTICLENRAIDFIENCAQAWSNCCYTVKGCSLQFILDWLWSLHKAYKANGNKICIPLFDQSGMKFDVSEKRSLQHCKSLLNTVQSVYISIANRFKRNIIVNGIEEKLTAMSLVKVYFDCCLKLISVNLLPEPNEQGRPSDSLVYQFDNINTYAIKRRKEGPFLADSLLGRTDAEKQWLEEGGTGLYPPPSIQSVLRFCLHPSPSYANKMSLFLYLFMDIINSYSPIRSQPVLDRIKNFQHLMRISEVQYKIVAGCWYFDHSLFDEGVDLLFDPRVLSVDLNEEQHRGILYLLACERREKLALQYLRMKSPSLNLMCDLRMELNLLLSNGLVNEAFLFQRKHPEMRETLLIEFFEGCIERKQLGQVFGLNLDFKEEGTLMKYLRSSRLKEKGDLQVLLLLSKAKYTEAMFLNDKLNSSINGPKSRIETDTRDMIVRGVTGSLNTISRHIANEMKNYRPPPAGSHPRPLSSLIKLRNGPDGPLFQTDSKVLLSTVAKSTRHLSDFVNSFESGHRRKREEEIDNDFDLENEPSRKRLKLLDTASDIHKATSLSGKWLTSAKSSASQNNDVMELVGTPLIKKRSKRLSPQSRPSSILKGKTPEKSIISEDFGETPKKTIRFALPENEIQITARKPLRKSEAAVLNKTSMNIVNSEDGSDMLVTEELSTPRSLGKLSAQKSLHISSSLNNSVTGLNSSSVIENIKDRLRSSSKKKVLEDGVNWHEIAEAAKPRILFTQGSSKITSVTKSVKTQSSTPMSQVLLDITVTSDEKKYLDSPSRGEETSPVTENLFNTTLLPKVLFSSVNNERETKERSPEDASMHAAFLKRYKQLRNKNITSSNVFVTPKQDKARGVRFEEEQSFNVIPTKNTVENFRSSITSTSIVIDKDISPKKESTVNENLLKRNNDELVEQKIRSELITDKEELDNESLLEKQKDYSNDKQKESLLTESSHNLINNKLYQDVENSLHESDPLLEDDVCQFKDEDEIAPENNENLTEDSGLKISHVEGNCSIEEPIDDCHDLSGNQNIIETQICYDVVSDDKICSNKSELINVLPSKESNLENEKNKNELSKDIEMSQKEVEIPDDNQYNTTKNCGIDKSEEVSSNNKEDCEEIIDIISDDEEDDNEDKQSPNESLSEEETSGMSAGSSEEIEEDVSENEEMESDNEGSLPNDSPVLSEGDDEENSADSMSDDHAKYSEIEMDKDETADDEKDTIFLLSDDSEDETSSEEKKDFRNKFSNVETREPKAKACSLLEQDYEDVSGSEVFGLKNDKSDYNDEENSQTKASSQLEQDYDDVSDSEVFGLKNVRCDYKEEENSVDDMWIGLDSKESIVSQNMNKSRQEVMKDSISANSSEENLVSPRTVDNPFIEDPEIKHVPSISLDKEPVVHVSSFAVEEGSKIEAVHSIAVDEDPVVKVVSSFAVDEDPNVEPASSIALDEDPVVQVVSSFTVEEGSEIQTVHEGLVVEDVSSVVKRHITEIVSEEETLAEEIQPVSINNEDSCSEKFLNKAKDVLDLKEDFQSIEKNWTQQIEKEMKQDSVLLKIESDNKDSVNISGRQLLNVGSKIISKELTDVKSVDKSDQKGFYNSKIVSSLQTQNKILVGEESERSEVAGESVSIKSTTNLSSEGNNALDKDKLSHFDKSESCLLESDKENEDDLVVAHLNEQVDDHQKTEKDCDINISEVNNVTNTPLVLSTQECFLKHPGNSLKIVEENNFSSQASSTNISSESTVSDTSSDAHQSVSYKLQGNNAFNNNKTLSKEKNASFSAFEKSKVLGSILSDINLISVEAEANKLSENIGECSHTTKHEETQENSSLNVRTKKNESERATEIYEKDNSINDDEGNGNMFVSIDLIQSQNNLVKVPEATSQSTVEQAKHSTVSEHPKESKILERISAQGEKDIGSCTEVGDIKFVHRGAEISTQVESKYSDTNSEVIYKTLHDEIPSSSQVMVESSETKAFTSSKQESDHVRNRTEEQVMTGSEEAKGSNTVIDQLSPSGCSDRSCQPNMGREKDFEKGSNNILNEHNINIENVPELNSVGYEIKVCGDEKSTVENVSLCANKDIHSDLDSLDCQLNNAQIDVYNDTLTSVAANPLEKDTHYDVQNVISIESTSKFCSEKTSIEKSFFFGKEDIETYIRSTKATFQIGGHVSLPEEDEPIDPMEVAMIEDEEKTIVQPSPMEPDIELSLHLSPDHIKKPKKVDQGIVTDNSYLQRRARKLRKSVKNLLKDANCLENKIIVNAEYHGSNLLNIGNERKCISTQTSDDIYLSESDEELIDHTKISGPSQKSLEQQKKISRKMRHSSEPPLTYKEDFKRKSSLCPQEQHVKGILKKNDLIENFDDEHRTKSKIDLLPVRRSRRLSECVTETKELLRNQFEKDQHINSQRKSRGYSEEPDFYRISSYKDKQSSDNEKEGTGKHKILKQRPRRLSEEPEMQAMFNENLEKRKVLRSSEEPGVSYKYPDEGRRNSMKSDYTDFKHSEEPEIRGILKKRSKQTRKTSLSCEMINELKHYEESDSRQTFRKLRSQSEEPGELQEIPKKRFRHSRSSYTHETAANIHCEEILLDSKNIHKYSENAEIQGTKERNRRSRRYSEEPEMLKTHTKREKSSQSSDGDKEFNLQEHVRRIRRHSEEPEMRGILKKRSSINRKSLCTTETVSNFKLQLEDDLPFDRREPKELSEESGVKGIIKKGKSSRRRNSNAGETDKDLERERDSPEHKNRPLLDHDSHKSGKKRSISRKTDSINCEKTTKDFNEECSGNENKLQNQTCLYVSGTNVNNFSDDMVKLVTDADEPNKELKHSVHPSTHTGEKDARLVDENMKKVRDGDDKEIDTLSSAEQVSQNKRAKRFNLLSHDEECQQAKESPAKIRRRSSSTAIAKEESSDVISLPEGETKPTRKSLRRTPDKKEVNAKLVLEERKRKVEPEDEKFVPKRLEYSDDESPGKKKSRSLIDFPIKKNRRLPRPTLEDIREEDEDLLKNKSKSLDDFHLEEMKKRKGSKKTSASKLVIGDSDVDSDVSTPELWKKDVTKEKRSTRPQQKHLLMNQQLASVSEIESPSTSSPRRNTRKKLDVTDSPLKTPTRSSLRLQKKPPTETE